MLVYQRLSWKLALSRDLYDFFIEQKIDLPYHQPELANIKQFLKRVPKLQTPKRFVDFILKVLYRKWMQSVVTFNELVFAHIYVSETTSIQYRNF